MSKYEMNFDLDDGTHVRLAATEFYQILTYINDERRLVMDADRFADIAIEARNMAAACVKEHARKSRECPDLGPNGDCGDCGEE